MDVGSLHGAQISVLVLLALPSLPLTAQDSGIDRFSKATSFQEASRLINEQMTKHDLPSLTISVAQHGRIVWEEGFGWADKERLIRATPDTMYRIASITKPLTATGLMRLSEAKNIGLDVSINDYLGDVKLIAPTGDPRQATVRRIANHTAGVPQHWQFFYSTERVPVPSADETLLHYGIIARPPGEKFEYSNLNYAALAKAIEHVSGLRFDEYMHTRVFVPLGMTHTFFEPTVEVGSYLAANYDQSGTRLPDFKTDYPGAAGAYSSSHDLIRFAMYHLKDHLSDQRRILSDANIDQMQVATAPVISGKSYGIGWHLDTVRHTVEHGGYFPGASAIIRLVPNADAAVVVLTNINNDDQQTALNLIADTALGILIPGWKQAPVEPAAPVPSQPFAAPPALVGKWVGFIHTYISDLPLTVEFLPTGEFARAQLSKQPSTALGNIYYNAAEGTLSGEMHGVLDIPDASRSQPYLLRFDFKTATGNLSGTVSTWYFQNSMYPRLAQWVSLTKQ